MNIKNKEEENIVVSICCLAYNHESFIRKCLDGFLIQKTQFAFEVLVNDDASTDRTAKIIKEYQNKYPKIVKPIFQTINKFSVEGGGMNIRYNFPRAKGKYIALCEGDDYWTDPLKLQKQVDFLEKNPNYNICFHKVQLLKNKIIREADDITISRYNAITKFPIQVNELLEQGNFIHTPSVVFRNQILNFPFEFEFSLVGDYFLYIILANQGSIKRLDDTMAVYREGVGIYSILDNLSYQKHMLIYQSCILSYLNNKDQKGILLKRQIELINNHFNNIEKQIPSDEVLLKGIGIKKLFKLTFMKIFKKLSTK